MIKKENYITIQGWMITELCLKGSDLLCYALIYGFCQDGNNVFSGSLQYISDWLNIDKRNVIEVLKRLCSAGYIKKIEKEINGIKLCEYTTNIMGSDETSPVVMKHQWGGDETSGGGDETSPNNNIYNNNYNYILKEKIKNKKEKENEGCDLDRLIEIEEGVFYVDDDEKYSPGWSDLAKQLTEKDRLNVWKYIMNKFEYQSLKVKSIRKIIENYINNYKGGEYGKEEYQGC